MRCMVGSGWHDGAVPLVNRRRPMHAQREFISCSGHTLPDEPGLPSGHSADWPTTGANLIEAVFWHRKCFGVREVEIRILLPLCLFTSAKSPCLMVIAIGPASGKRIPGPFPASAKPGVRWSVRLCSWLYCPCGRRRQDRACAI